MVFSTRVCRKRSARTLRPGWLRVLASLALLLSAPVYADEFTIDSIDTRLEENVYLLDAHINYQFSDDALKALHSGVPLTLLIEIDVQRKRRWWLDADIASLEQRFRLVFHAISGQYVVYNLNSGALYPFHTLDGALQALGTLKDFPLLDAQLVEDDEDYEVEMMVSLEIEALPAPLRPLAYITPAWRLNSDWYSWSLTP